MTRTLTFRKTGNFVGRLETYRYDDGEPIAWHFEWAGEREAARANGIGAPNRGLISAIEGAVAVEANR